MVSKELTNLINIDPTDSGFPFRELLVKELRDIICKISRYT